MAIKESTHWYDKSGAPVYTVIGKNGKERATNLRDAREHGYVPGVTTILNVAAKPALENWKIDQALMSALTLPKTDDESLDDFIKRAKADSKQQSIDAAARGTEIHAQIEKYFRGDSCENPSIGRSIRNTLGDLFGMRLWLAEESFHSNKGYGGKIDLMSQDGEVFVDFKSKDGIADKDASKLVYDEHGMQLSAYAAGASIVDTPDRVSVFVDRATYEIKVHVWDKESFYRHLAMFYSLLDFWKMSKGYDSQTLSPQ